MAKKRPYLVVLHSMSPIKGTPTHIAGWRNRSNQNINENIELCVNIKNRYYAEASVIIDLLSQKVVKNRFEKMGHDETVKYYFTKYNARINAFLTQFMERHGSVEEVTELVNSLIPDTDAEAS